MSSRNNDLVLQINKILNTCNEDAFLQKICKKMILTKFAFIFELLKNFFILFTKTQSACMRFFLY